MNTLYIDIKIFKSPVLYFSIIISTLLSLACSVETNQANEQVNETLISKQWIRDSYVSKNSNGNFENYNTKSELQFFSNGNLLIKESKSTDSNGTGSLPPPQGLVDTLVFSGKWMYFQNTNTLTLKVDDSISQHSTYNYVNWKLSYIDDNQFKIENTEIDSLEIIKVNFKRKI